MAAGSRGPRLPAGRVCESRRRLTRIVPEIEGLWHCVTHAACICNEYVSAHNRVLGRTPVPTRSGLQQLRFQARLLKKRLFVVTPLTEDAFIEHYEGPKRTRYANAASSLVNKPLDHRDGRVDAFIKGEKFDPGAKCNPDPRMIQSRNARYNLRVGIWLKAMEHQLYRLRSDRGHRLIAKGLNTWERGRVLHQKWCSFLRPVAYSIDASRWDKHISRSVLEIEHSVYDWMSGGDLELRLYLRWQLVNRVRTSNGLRYRVDGGRMSGDMNTALGNCLLMVLMVRAAMSNYPGHWELFDDGDDCIVMVEQRDEEYLERLPSIFLEFGQELKLENRTTNFESIKFCQCQPVLVPLDEMGEVHAWRMVRDWKRVLSHDTCGIKHWDDVNLILTMFKAVGLCNVALHSGVPILWAHAAALMRLAGTKCHKAIKTIWLNESLEHRIRTECRLYTPEHAPSQAFGPSALARESFARAFQVPVDQQLAIEAKLDSWTLDSHQVRDCDLERDHRWVDLSGVDAPRVW